MYGECVSDKEIDCGEEIFKRLAVNLLYWARVCLETNGGSVQQLRKGLNSRLC